MKEEIFFGTDISKFNIADFTNLKFPYYLLNHSQALQFRLQPNLLCVAYKWQTSKQQIHNKYPINTTE